MKKTILLFIILIGGQLQSQNNSNVELTDYIRESQQWIRANGKHTLTWWLPTSYWRVALSGNKQITEETIAQIEAIFGSYVLICAADIYIDTNNGSTSFTADSVLKKGITITDITGKIYKPLNTEQLSNNAITMIESIKPMLTQLLGQMGKGMYFYFFEIRTKNGENIINERKNGFFKVNHSKCEFKWNLPMATLMPSKFCPTDNEKMHGNWNYCPFHGVKLD